MPDDFDLDMLMPAVPEETPAITDVFDYNVAMDLAVIGVGQCGGRIADAMYSLGYRRVGAINTTASDLATLTLPDDAKLDTGGSGAAKDPWVGLAELKANSEKIYDFLKRCIGDTVDRVLVCFGAAGGTGAGGFSVVAEIAARVMTDLGLQPKIGLIVALPKSSEGQRQAMNTLRTVRRLSEATYSPIVVIDNQKILDLYRPSVSQEHNTANRSVCQILHTFNRLSGTASEHTTFDRADFDSMLSSGLLTFGVAQLADWSNETRFTEAVRNQLAENTLLGVSLSSGKQAALLFVLHGKAYDEVKASYLDYTAQMLSRTLGDGSTVYQGVYRGTSAKDGVQLLAMVGGLELPQKRLAELRQAAGGASVDDL